MKKFVIAFMICFLLLTSSSSQDARPLKFDIVSAPTERFTKRWTFVVDTSASLKGIFFRVNTAFLEATKFPTDDLHFGVITFNNSGNTEVMRVGDGTINHRWFEANPDTFKRASEWIHLHGGVRSFGAEAIRQAFRQERNDLTIILITDGGFSEGFAEIRQAIEDGKMWRAVRSLTPAIVGVIGIENTTYTAGNKPSDEMCQAFLKEIGESCGGGYYLVSGSH